MNLEFKDEPILLMSNTLEITNEGIEFLKSLKETKIAVVCISGPMFSGKSFIGNLFLDRRVNGFEIGSMEKVQSTCTKGLWVWGRPISVEDYHLLLIDSEGLFRTEDTIEYDQKIFALCTLLSSMLIYNSNNQMGSNIAQFSKVSERIQQIKLQEDIKINQNYLPDLLWLVRDYEKDTDNIETKFAELTKDQTIFNSFFNKAKCFGVPMPMSEDDMLIKLYQDESEQFSAEFVGQFGKIKKYILAKARPKKINNIFLNGKLLYGILQNYSESLNSSEYLVIMDTLECVLLSNANEIAEDILDKFRIKYKKQIEDEDTLTIIDRYKIAFELLEKEEIQPFCSSDIGKVLHSNFIVEALQKIVSLTKEAAEGNYQQSLSGYEKIIDQVINKLNQSSEKIASIDNVRPALLTFTSFLKDQLDTLANYSSFTLSKNFPLLLDSIQSKLLSLTDMIDKAIEISKDEEKALKTQLYQTEKAMDDKSKEMSNKDNKILELQSEIERLSRENKTKDKENVNNIEIEKNKYSMLEEHNKALIEEKDKAIKELEERIDNLSRELADALKDNLTKTNDLRKVQQEFEDRKVNDTPDKSSIADLKKINMKSIYKSIQSTLLEYKETVDQLEREKDTVFRTKYIEHNSKEVDSKTKVWIDELRLFREQHNKLMTENYQKEVVKGKEENAALKFELTKVTDGLKIIEIDYNSLKEQYEEMKKNMKETEIINDKREQLIKDQKDVITQNETIIRTLKSDKEDLELELNRQIINQKIQSSDYVTIFQLFFAMAKKQRDKFDNCFFELSKENRARAFYLNRDLNIFKLNEKDIEK